MILDGEGRLRILDFGLARLEGQESLTLSGDFLGTPLYMSPEQARARKVPLDHRTDIYSLGATLYEMLTLRPPFRGKNHQDTLSQIMERDPVEPRKFNPRVPRDLETIVLKCLRKEPGERYGTAEALAQDLSRFVRGDPIEARPQAGWERLARSARRHGRKLAALGAFCALLVVLGALVWRQWVSERDPTRLRHDTVVLKAAKEIYRGRPQVLGMEIGGDLLRQFLLRSSGTRVGGLKELLDSLREVAEAAPDRPEAPYSMARAHWLAGDVEAARSEAQRALARSPEFRPPDPGLLAVVSSRGSSA